MFQKALQQSSPQSSPQRKAHYLQRHNGDSKKIEQPIQPFRNTINNDPISMRLEQIKKKYSDANKSPASKCTPNNVASRGRVTSQNKNQYKLTQKSFNDCPNKTLTKTHIQILAKTSYDAIRNKSLNSSSNKFQSPSKLSPKNLQKNQRAQKGQEDQRIDAIQKINSKIKCILDGITFGKKQFETNLTGLKQLNVELSPSTKQSRLSAKFINQRNENLSNQFNKNIGHKKGLSFAHLNKQPFQSAINIEANQKEIIKNIIPTNINQNRKLSVKQIDDEIFQIQQRIKKSTDEREKITGAFDKNAFYKQNDQKNNVTLKNEIDNRNKRYSYFEKSNNKVSQYRRNDSNNYSTYGHSEKYQQIQKESNTIQQYYPIKTASNLKLKVLPVPCDSQFLAQQTQRLALALSQQVKLDEELRNAKIWLQNSNDPNKWIKLMNYFNKGQVKKYTQIDVKQIFTLSQDEHNPFFSFDSEQSLQGIIVKQKQAISHWKNQIVSRFNYKKLQEQGLSLQSLDCSQKGYIQMQDLVRFLNVQTGNFYRTRDMVLIFRRMSKTAILSFNDFVQTVSYF